LKTWNIAIVGAGVIADFHAKAIGDLGNGKLAGFFDLAVERAAQLAQKYSVKAYNTLDQLLGDPGVDVIAIATPSGAHMEPAIAAAHAIIHVLCEKPLEITLKRVDAMIDAHKKAGTLLGGIFQSRFCEGLQPIRNAVKAGRFGTITYAGAYVPWWRVDAYYTGSWHGTWKLDGGGALMNQSIHRIDLLCSLMPPVESVMAYTAHQAHPQHQPEDTAVAGLRFQGGALGIIYGTTGSFPGLPMRLEISGTKGTAIYVDDSLTTWQFAEETPEDEQIRKKYSQVRAVGGSSDPTAIPYHNHTANYRAFLSALDNKTSFEVNAEEAKKSIRVIRAIYLSAQQNRQILLNDVQD